MNSDKYFSRKYHKSNYNCAHLVCEVWEELHGSQMAEALRGFLCKPSNRVVRLSDLRKIKVVSKPVSTCVVFMQAAHSVTHVGIWLRGKVLHIGEQGVQYQPLEVAAFGFKKIRFLTC